jgi:hypothetical protein
MEAQERDRITAERTQAYFSEPFAPNRHAPDAAHRIANALEYAAVQLGTIARAAEKIESHLETLATKHAVPGSAEDVVLRALRGDKT